MESRLTANSFNECNGTTRSSWSAVNSIVGGCWIDLSGCCSHGLRTLCNGEYLKQHTIIIRYHITHRHTNSSTSKSATCLYIIIYSFNLIFNDRLNQTHLISQWNSSSLSGQPNSEVQAWPELQNTKLIFIITITK